MPQRKGRILEIMEMERLRVRIIDLRVVMMVIADGGSGRLHGVDGHARCPCERTRGAPTDAP